MAKKKSGLNVSTPVLYILLGALLVIFRSQTLEWAMTLAGIFFIVSGVIDISKKNMLGGIVNLVIGIAVLVLGWAITGIVLLVLGVFIAIKGLVDFLGVMKLKKKKRTFIKMILPILTIVVGLALAFGNGLDYVIIAVGVILIVDGLLGFVGKK